MATSHRRLATVVAANAVLAFALAHLWIDRVEHLHLTMRHVWPALAVGASSGLVLLVLGDQQPRHRGTSIAVGLALVATLVGSLAMGRTRPVTTNAEFVRSMIPLESEAIRLCRSARPSAPELTEFCASLVQRREAEIWDLQRLLRRW